MKHATRNLVSNSESFSSAFLPTYAYNCSPVTKFRTSILTLCIYESESRNYFFVLVREQRQQVVTYCNMKFKRTCFAQIKVVRFIYTVLVSGSSSYVSYTRCLSVAALPTFHKHGACQWQLFLRVIRNYESSRQFRTLLRHISFVLYCLFVCLFVDAYGDVMRQY
jgi:hypothetical protein